MQSLSLILESAGCEQLQTYIQSGNAVFNPYPEAASEPKSLHLFFLERAPQQELINDANQLLSESESFTVIGSLLYQHAPDGVARSRFGSGIGKALQMKTTARNWRTVLKLEELASAIK